MRSRGGGAGGAPVSSAEAARVAGASRSRGCRWYLDVHQPWPKMSVDDGVRAVTAARASGPPAWPWCLTSVWPSANHHRRPRARRKGREVRCAKRIDVLNDDVYSPFQGTLHPECTRGDLPKGCTCLPPRGPSARPHNHRRQYSFSILGTVSVQRARSASRPSSLLTQFDRVDCPKPGSRPRSSHATTFQRHNHHVAASWGASVPAAGHDGLQRPRGTGDVVIGHSVLQ